MRDYVRHAGTGVLVAAAIGMIVSTGCSAVVDLYRQRPLLTAWDRTDSGIAIIAALPFAILSLLGIRNIWAWGIGVGATLAFWGWLYLPSAMEIGGGANIGLGLALPVYPLGIVMVAMLGLLPEASRDDG